ncbi:hypothetical protein T492DRAFT_975279 [Pavlovales sp. CCMP2436]|nr:hypothetical protein T492DRAFT_975279 [Pavlovales sp. CCMP2436]
MASRPQAPTLTSQAIDAYLEENAALLEAMHAAEALGNVRAALAYAVRLQQNLLHLGVHADRYGEPQPPGRPVPASLLAQAATLLVSQTQPPVACKVAISEQPQQVSAVVVLPPAVHVSIAVPPVAAQPRPSEPSVAAAARLPVTPVDTAPAAAEVFAAPVATIPSAGPSGGAAAMGADETRGGGVQSATIC